jgi:choline dehydrogenase-like flavoprotein
LLPSYRAISDRIGVSSPALTEALRRVFARCVATDSLRIEHARNAVLERPAERREACTRCGLCLWGCARKSIYSSAYELPQLRRFPNFSYRSGVLVREVRAHGEGHALVLDGGETLRAGCVVLAAGTIGTTALVMGRLGLWGEQVRLLSNPVAAAAFLIPSLIGADLPDESFSLAQLRWEVPIAGGGAASGALYGADALPLTEIASRMPLSRPTALRLARALAPALVLATIYLPGRFSRNTLRIAPKKGNRVMIESAITDEARSALRAAHATLARGMRKLGALPVPRSFTISPPGADAHYGGTVPMGGPQLLGCSATGEVHGSPGLYVVDGAALSALPSKHCTFTMMANADRIARGLARRERVSG